MEQRATKAARAWLALVDAGEYSKSWDESAEFFKGVVPKSQWETSLKGVRKPLGKLIKRKVWERRYTRSLPAAPDGEYVVIKFNTSFENKKKAVETVTPMLDEDGQWRVSGYYIR
jgi:hypothetical protein